MHALFDKIRTPNFYKNGQIYKEINITAADTSSWPFNFQFLKSSIVFILIHSWYSKSYNPCTQKHRCYTICASIHSESTQLCARCRGPCCQLHVIYRLCLLEDFSEVKTKILDLKLCCTLQRTILRFLFGFCHTAFKRRLSIQLGGHSVWTNSASVGHRIIYCLSRLIYGK